MPWDVRRSVDDKLSTYKLCRFTTTHFTIKSAISGQDDISTIAQTPTVNNQHITRVWCCTHPGAPTSQGWWRPKCSSTKGQWRLQCASTPKGDFVGGETGHGGNRIHKDTLAIQFKWKGLDCSGSLGAHDWSPGWSVGISRCSCWYTLCVTITWWSISWNRFANPRSCMCVFCILLLDWTCDDIKPQKYT